MNKLKTLKDIYDDDWYNESDIYSIDANEVVEKTKETLRAEAVKWVKEEFSFNTEMNSSREDFGKFAIKKWIMHFFNLTDEELK